MFFVLIISSLGYVIGTDNSTVYIHQLEQKISDLESKNQATEQKQAAVLASILSKLQAQDEKIKELTDDLQNITLNSSAVKSTTGGHVAFEARSMSESSSRLVHFQKVMCNDGGGYNPTTGSFTAPATGTYHFWFSAYVSSLHPNYSSQILFLEAKGSSYGSHASHATEMLKSVISKDNHDRNLMLVQGQNVIQLNTGDKVSVRLTSGSNTVIARSTFGGMLLR